MLIPSITFSQGRIFEFTLNTAKPDTVITNVGNFLYAEIFVKTNTTDVDTIRTYEIIPDDNQNRGAGTVDTTNSLQMRMLSGSSYVDQNFIRLSSTVTRQKALILSPKIWRFMIRKVTTTAADIKVKIIFR